MQRSLGCRVGLVFDRLDERPTWWAGDSCGLSMGRLVDSLNHDLPANSSQYSTFRSTNVLLSPDFWKVGIGAAPCDGLRLKPHPVRKKGLPELGLRLR